MTTFSTSIPTSLAFLSDFTGAFLLVLNPSWLGPYPLWYTCSSFPPLLPLSWIPQREILSPICLWTLILGTTLPTLLYFSLRPQIFLAPTRGVSNSFSTPFASGQHHGLVWMVCMAIDVIWFCYKEVVSVTFGLMNF